jgi:hypothetical protein
MTDQKEEGTGPVPVRDLMKVPAPESDGDAEPQWEGSERAFELEGEEWTVRAAGTGAYGTGGHGVARLLAVHFYRASDPDRPVREALVPAGLFAGLWPDELRTLYQRATPIVLDDQ